MNKNKVYIKLEDLEVYKLARELSKIGWEIYEPFDWQMKKIIGDQFIESTDSVGANITEGYGRFHYLDKIKFYYNARASLNECNNYWIELLKEREKVELDKYKEFKDIAEKLLIKLNRWISATFQKTKK
ncbi:four helix bundle protein [Patescibacteria group bacterium]|nr:four helix bundle protein [Patescibacteria group bacterium]MBU4458785.1 four helix bundle protein [Patescibacteria group bacterium]